jgi:sugar phosphate isomerase/epimerase
MKLAVFTDEVSQDLETALKLAVKYHLDGVEIRSVWDKPVHQLSSGEVDQIAGLLERHDLRLAAIASPVFKCELDNEEEQRDHLEYLRSCCRIAGQLGTNLIRVFTFWKRGPAEPVWERIKQQFQPAVPIAEEAGMVLAIENEHTTYCATAEETKRFVVEIDSPAVRVVWDPCNEAYAEDGVIPYPDAYRKVAPFLVHLHVKDAEKDSATGEARLSPVGEGTIDWRRQLGELLKTGYDGYASLETHWRPQSLPEEVLNRPGGEGFSEAGEYASDLCLKNLAAILAQARADVG